jgi:hypothetical protein
LAGRLELMKPSKWLLGSFRYTNCSLRHFQMKLRSLRGRATPIRRQRLQFLDGGYPLQKIIVIREGSNAFHEPHPICISVMFPRRDNRKKRVIDSLFLLTPTP